MDWVRYAGFAIRRNQAAAAESACRQYRAVRWFLLPEGELAGGKAASDYKSAVTAADKAVPPNGHIIHEQAFLACEGRVIQKKGDPAGHP